MTNKPETPRAACDIYLMINSDGEYVATHNGDYVNELYGDEIGGTPDNVRTIHLTLSVPLPYGVEASATIPDDVQSGDALTVTVED
jgi:hypothetical protein